MVLAGEPLLLVGQNCAKSIEAREAASRERPTGPEE
jgi:hypothetical protein